MSRTLDFLGLAAALFTAVFVVYIMVRWPPGRDPRPMAPALALAIAFFFLKLPVAMEWPIDFAREREIAWKIWFIVVFANFLLFAYLYGNRLADKGPGGPCAVKREGNELPTIGNKGV